MVCRMWMFMPAEIFEKDALLYIEHPEFAASGSHTSSKTHDLRGQT